jgi:hypothetical protein
MPRQSSMTGPDWTDIMAYMSALDSLHGCTTWLDISSAGTNYGTQLRVTVVSVWPVLKGEGRALKVATQGLWPSVNDATMEGAVLKLLVEHDYRFSREVYTQERLPGA